jgi:hypothetical protein
VAPRFLIDENLSPMLASHLTGTHGFDAVHLNSAGLRGANDVDVLAYAVANDRIVMTSNADDYRKLARNTVAHSGLAVLLAVLLDAVGRRLQIELGTMLANTIDTEIGSAGTAHGRVFEIDASGRVRNYRLP